MEVLAQPVSRAEVVMSGRLGRSPFPKVRQEMEMALLPNASLVPHQKHCGNSPVDMTFKIPAAIPNALLVCFVDIEKWLLFNEHIVCY